MCWFADCVTLLSARSKYKMGHFLFVMKFSTKYRILYDTFHEEGCTSRHWGLRCRKEEGSGHTAHQRNLSYENKSISK